MHAEKVLRILHVEDSALDAELVRAALEEQGISASWVQVQNRDDFLRAMESGEYDLIISDYSMPSFDGLTALSLAKEKKPEVPFIYLSGTIGEERAVEALQNGATDYVLKDRMFRLGAVIRRSMRDAALRVRSGSWKNSFIPRSPGSSNSWPPARRSSIPRRSLRGRSRHLSVKTSAHGSGMIRKSSCAVQTSGCRASIPKTKPGCFPACRLLAARSRVHQLSIPAC